jgi:hypothetical protein
VLAHANVEMVRGRAVGLRYADDGVAAVRYVDDDGEHTIPGGLRGRRDGRLEPAVRGLA